MIKAKQIFFWTSNLKGHGFHGDKPTIFYLTSEYYSLSVLSAKLYFLEIDPVNQKVWPFKCMMLKTLNSNFLDLEDTLRNSRRKIDYPGMGRVIFEQVWNISQLILASSVHKGLVSHHSHFQTAQKNSDYGSLFYTQFKN